MNNLKREMNQVWDYISNHPGVYTFDLAKAFSHKWGLFHSLSLIEALVTDSYIRKELNAGLTGGHYCWVVRIFP